MKSNKKIFKLKGCVQHYAWGGEEFIPGLLGMDNSEKKPFAEYWMGAHPSACGTIATEAGETEKLDELIKADATGTIGKKVSDHFGEFPYLFKILDVQEMLSIQVHPSKAEAAKGFEAEEASGIPINASNRNYKDKNHKPEVMIALSDFYLLHGFKKENALRETLQSVPEFNSLLSIFDNEGYFGLYKTVMKMPADKADAILKPIVERELTAEHEKHQPGYWVKKLYEKQIPAGAFDRGIFSIYFFNIVYLQKGEGIFQGAGVPHAYLQGQNVELMANSDNVLRGGLTPKHIDVAELLKHTIFEGIEPQTIQGQATQRTGETEFTFPVEDFGISSITLKPSETYRSHTQSAEIILVLDGAVVADGLTFGKGEVILILNDADYTLEALAESQLYRAFVPVEKL